MKAALFEQYRQPLMVTEVSNPQCPEDGIIVRVMACGVCRSDYHAWNGEDPDVCPPHVPGHEFAGIVETVGRRCSRWKKRDRVTAPFILACGECPGCRYAAAGQHPDLLRLELLVIDPDEGTLQTVETIGIDRVRALTEFAQLTSHRQRAKVAVISPAERMNAAAANALLKTLEEPPPGTYVILVSDQPGRLPPTILSRCRKLAVPLSAEDAEAMVRQLAVLPVVAIDSSLVVSAITGSRASQISIRDALIHRAAETAGCRRVLSEDLADGTTYGSVVGENPFARTR